VIVFIAGVCGSTLWSVKQNGQVADEQDSGYGSGVKKDG